MSEEREPVDIALEWARDNDSRLGSSDAYDWGFERGFRAAWEARETDQQLPLVGWSDDHDCDFHASDHCMGWHGDDFQGKLPDGRWICHNCIEVLAIVDLRRYHGEVPDWQAF